MNRTEQFKDRIDRIYTTRPRVLLVGHYEREGEIKIGDTALDSPSEREIARRKRMKREG